MATKKQTAAAKADHNFEMLTNVMQPSFEALREAGHKQLLASVKGIFAKLDAAGWDYEKAYPLNPSKYDAGTNAQRAAKVAAMEWLQYDRKAIDAQYNAGSRHHSQHVYFMQPIEGWEAKVAQQAIDSANYWIQSFVIKMTKKLADTSNGLLAGSMEFTGTANPWDRSHLYVRYTNLTQQRWNTQCIINCSVHGKLFNQWPTRLAK